MYSRRYTDQHGVRDGIVAVGSYNSLRPTPGFKSNAAEVCYNEFARLRLRQDVIPYVTDLISVERRATPIHL